MSQILKKLFTEAYETENSTSTILVQHFLTGLLPPIRRQLLLQGKPDTLTQAVKDVVNIEYVLKLAGEADNSQEVNTVHLKPSTQESSGHNKFQESLDQIVKCLEKHWKWFRNSHCYPKQSILIDHITINPPVDNVIKGDSMNTQNQLADFVVNLVTTSNTAL